VARRAPSRIEEIMIPQVAKWCFAERFGEWASEDLMTPDDAI